ncbi:MULTISPECIES: RNA polymerase sigma factor RpoD/SigA [Pseudobacillus]|uniref:sigma-70 family RNA polymerase sigma factor n=1 Tax=Pseudobacillus TaxID=108525 RepID=UPI0038797566
MKKQFTEKQRFEISGLFDASPIGGSSKSRKTSNAVPLHPIEQLNKKETPLPYPSITADSLQLYIRDISSYHLLSKEEEIMLAKEIEKGNEEARTKLVCHNLRLVVSIARKYMKNDKKLDMLEMIQEGNTGLIKAAQRYDYKLGFRFVTYAHWWIRHEILHFISGGMRTIRLTPEVATLVNKYHYAVNRITVYEGREPSVEEAANFVQADKDKMEEALNYFKETETLSLFSKSGSSSDPTYLEDFIESPEMDVFETTARKMKEEMIEEMLCDLSEREELVVRLRFGFDDGKPRTLEDIGKILGVTRERIRQIEHHALSEIRRHRLIHSLSRMRDEFEDEEKMEKFAKTK